MIVCIFIYMVIYLNIITYICITKDRVGNLGVQSLIAWLLLPLIFYINNYIHQHP